MGIWFQKRVSVSKLTNSGIDATIPSKNLKKYFIYNHSCMMQDGDESRED
jgi:hypothetical protein